MWLIFPEPPGLARFLKARCAPRVGLLCRRNGESGWPWAIKGQRTRSDRLRGRKHRRSVALDLDIGPYANDPAVRSDQECGPDDSHEGFAVHRFFTPDSICLEHCVRGIGAKRNRQSMFGLEGILG